MTEVRKYLSKNKVGKCSLGDVEYESTIEHVVVLDEMTIEKAVNVINAKAVVDKKLMAKIDKHEAMKKTIYDVNSKIREIGHERKRLIDSRNSDEAVIGGYVIEGKVEGKHYNRILERCKETKVKLNTLWEQQQKLEAENKALIKKRQALQKELGV